MSLSGGSFHSPVSADSPWHQLSPADRKEVARAWLKEALTSAEYADDEKTEGAIYWLARVFW